MPKKNQAEWVLLNLDGHPSGIKDKIQESIGESLEENEDGIEAIITFLKTIYDVDEFRELSEMYDEFEDIRRGANEDISQYILRWNLQVTRVERYECSLSDTLKALKLLKTSNLTQNQYQLVVSAIDYKGGKAEKAQGDTPAKPGTLEFQTKEALKKLM